jgi:hypothetical protein
VDRIIYTLDEKYFALEKLLTHLFANGEAVELIELKPFNHRFNLILKINMLKIKEVVIMERLRIVNGRWELSLL